MTLDSSTASGIVEWLSNDPIGISGGLNQYGFCGNNPVNFGDPFGLCKANGPATLPVAASITLAPGLWDWATSEGAGTLLSAAELSLVRAVAGVGSLIFISGDESANVQDFYMRQAQRQGERGWAKGPQGTPKPYKGWKEDPDDPGRILGRDRQTGKKISKPKPPDWGK